MRRIIIMMAMTAIMGMATGCKTARGTVEPTAANSVMPSAVTAEATMPQGRLTAVEYDFRGMRVNTVEHPRLKRTADGATLTVRVGAQDDVTFEVSDTLLDAARNIIEEERMYAYESYYELPPELGRVLDGYNWRFVAVFDDGARISSGGRHVSPDGNGLFRINKLLTEAAEACMAQK